MPFFLPVAAEALESKMAPQCRDHLFFSSLSLPLAALFFSFVLFFRAVETNVESTVWSRTETKRSLGKWWSLSILTYFKLHTHTQENKKKKVLVC